MRLFTGIALEAHVLERLRKQVDAARLPHLHITTKFIGEWPEERLEELKDALRLVNSPKFEVTISGYGAFPRALYAGVQGEPQLTALARQTDHACEAVGIAREERAYFPHVTLARTKSRPKDFPPQEDFGTFTVSDFHLYLSRSSHYTKLETFPLS